MRRLLICSSPCSSRFSSASHARRASSRRLVVMLQSVVHRERSSRSRSILRVDVRRENAPVVNLQLAVFFEVLKRIPCSEG